MSSGVCGGGLSKRGMVEMATTPCLKSYWNPETGI